jgi:hypothetical protein
MGSTSQAQNAFWSQPQRRWQRWQLDRLARESKGFDVFRIVIAVVAVTATTETECLPATHICLPWRSCGSQGGPPSNPDEGRWAPAGAEAGEEKISDGLADHPSSGFEPLPSGSYAIEETELELMHKG